MKKKTKIITLVILSIVLAVSIGVTGLYYYKQYQAGIEYEALKKQAKKDTSQPKEEIKPQETAPLAVVIPINFEELWKTNKDIYAWIQVPGTNIDYPILQSGEDKEESYYLDHTVENAQGLPGAIYTHKAMAKDFSNFNTIIYGHNMKDGSMFANLHKYQEETFFNENKIVNVYTQDAIRTYQIFAEVIYDDRLINSAYDFTQREQCQSYLDSIYGSREMNNRYAQDITAAPEDKILTLSTCIGDRPENRLLVLAKLIDTQYASSEESK